MMPSVGSLIVAYSFENCCNISGDFSFPVGLRVQAGRTLALVGSGMVLEGGRLEASGGRVELGSVGSPSFVNLAPTEQGWALGYEGVQNFQDIQLSQNAFILGDNIQLQGRQVTLDSSSSASAAKDLTITAGKLIVRDGATLSTFHFEGSRGNLTVRASESVEVIGTDAYENSSSLSNDIFGAQAPGDLIIETGKLIVREGARVSTFGSGRNLTVRASESVEVIGTDANKNPSSLFNSNLNAEAAGDLTIETGKLIVQDGRLFTSTSDAGDAGDLIVRASDSVEVSGGGSIVAQTGLGSTGTGGNLTIETKRLQGGTQLAVRSLGQGPAGILTVITPEPLPTVETQIIPDETLPISSTVRADDFNTSTIEGGTQVGSNLFHSFAQFSLPILSTAQFNNAPDIQNIISRVTGSSASNIDGLIQANGTANLFLINPNGIIFGRNALLDIGGSFVGSTATSLNFADGSVFSATARQTTSSPLTTSVPNGLQFGIIAGSILNQSKMWGGIEVLPERALALVGGDVSLDGGSLQAFGGRVELGGVSEAGTVGLFVDGNNLRLSFPDGVARANVSLTDSEIRADQRSGAINIQAGSISLNDSLIVTSDYYSYEGVAGNISLRADDSILLSKSTIASVVGFGESSGSINIQGRSISVTDESEVTVSTSQGVAGDININAADAVNISGNSEISAVGGSYGTYYPRISGTGGNINVRAGSLSLSNSAQLSTSSQGNGAAGNIDVDASSIRLDDQALLSSDTRRGQGNIELRSRDLVLRRESNITTNATGTATGGNINIEAGTIAALENSDISANSANSLGGRVTINAEGIFGTEFRLNPTPESDITAIGGRPELSGTVEINNPDVDPGQGLVELPAEIVDVSNQIAQGCSAGVRSGETKFVITGRGGLPPNPNDPLTGDNVLTEWNTLDSDAENRSSATPATNSAKESAPTTIVEANGWEINNKGEVILTASAPTASINIPWVPKYDCNAPEQKS